MAKNTKVVNFPTLTIAPIENVSRLMRAMYHTIDRQPHLPGMVVFYGPSGWGKSTAASYAQNKFNCYYVECKSVWTRKALLLAILKEMGIEPQKTIYQMVDQIAEQLLLSGRPLIVDEMDHIVEKNATELIRDIYECSHAPILLLGEERLPNKLKRWERFHGRILEWAPAQPVSMDDVEHLYRLYCKDVKISKDLLEKIHSIADGSVRRVCVNIEKVRADTIGQAEMKVDLKSWGDRELYTGEAPHRRV